MSRPRKISTRLPLEIQRELAEIQASLDRAKKDVHELTLGIQALDSISSAEDDYRIEKEGLEDTLQERSVDIQALVTRDKVIRHSLKFSVEAHWTEEPKDLKIQLESESAVELQAVEPPRGARLLARYLPKKHREFLLGDIDELFPLMVKEFGVKRARRRYWVGVIFSFWPLLIREVEKIAIIIGKLKIK